MDPQPGLPKVSPPHSPSLNATMIAEQIARLLSHYWAANEDPAMRRLMAEDWLGDLKEFSPALIASVCQEWRRSQSRRPMISDIRQLCRESQRTMATANRFEGVSDARDYVSERTAAWEAARQQRDVWATAHGCADFKEAMKIGLQQVGRRAQDG